MRRHFILPAAVVLSVTLAACGQNSSVQPPAATESQQGLFIDPQVQGEERAVMERVLSSLPPEDRENVIYISPDEHIYTNRPQLRSEVKQLKLVSPNTAKTPEGQLVSIPRLQPKPNVDGVQPQLVSTFPCNVSDGPFRRISSKIGGYGWARANLNLPGSSNARMSASSGGGYVTFGGWGSGSGGAAADAGLQFNKATSTTPIFWSGYLLVQGMTNAYTAGRFQPGSFTMSFYVSAANQVTVKIVGTPVAGTNTSSPTTITYGGATGWNASGSGNVIKRFQSMTNPVVGDYITNIQWSQVEAGTSVNTSTGVVTGQHYWTSSDTDPNSGGICNQGSINVTPNINSSGDYETVGIYK